ncbi:MAG: alanine racemase [Gemmatimonadetes bacterium]|nr:alanine racemase [Gemmatimonadota bacterium]
MTASLDALETPAALVDLDRMERNLSRAADYAREHAISLRPHVKTHKSPRIAAEQLRLGAVGVTCATPHEAEVMSAVCDDVLVAYPPVGRARAERLASLPAGVTLTVALDSEQAMRDIAAAAQGADRAVRVLVEVDVGMHRVGLPQLPDAIALAKLAQSLSPLEFWGIACYPGHVREKVAEQDAALAELDAALIRARRAFDHAGVPATVISAGSTPTMWRTHELSAVTEFRPGTYVYNDRTTAEIGACAWDDCAFTVLATVISTAVAGQAVIDAGTKSLGREPVRGSAGEGWGVLLDRREVVVSRMSEEHGILDLSRSSWKPEVGEQVRVIPNHVCICVHLNDLMYGVRGDVVETTWPVTARGRGEILPLGLN